MDYAKRAEEIAKTDYGMRAAGALLHQGRCDYLAGLGHCDCDRLEDVETVADILRAGDMAHLAELQAAHDAGVAEERARWAPAAAAARSALGKYAYDTGYGFFIGGDPRRFSPDEESSTSEEIAAWEVACAEAEADEKARNLSSPCGLETVEHEGRMVPAFVDRAPFGLGTYECGDDEAKAACEAITALLGDVAALGEAEGGR